MRVLFSNLSSLLFSVGILVSAQGFFISYLSLYFHQSNAGQVAGFIHSAYYAGLVIGAWQVEKLILRVGHIRAYAFFSALSSSSCLLMLLVSSPWFWAVARFVGGTCVAGQIVVFESWLLDKSAPSMRGRALALYCFVYCLFLGLGQFYLDIIQIKGIEPFIIFSVFTSLSILPLCYTKTSSPNFVESSSANIGRWIRAFPFEISACIGSGIILGSLYSFMPIFGVEKQLHVSTFVFLLILGGVLLQWPFGWLSDIVDRKKILISLCFLGLVPTLSLSFFSEPWVLYASAFLVGGAGNSMWMLAVNSACSGIEQKAITSATAALLLAYAAGCMIGPFVSGAVITHIHFPAFFEFLALLFAGLGAFGLFTLFAEEKVPLQQ